MLSIAASPIYIYIYIGQLEGNSNLVRLSLNHTKNDSLTRFKFPFNCTIYALNVNFVIYTCKEEVMLQ